MNGRRLLRLFFVIVSNGILFYFAMRDLLSPSDPRYWRVLAVAVCLGLLAGIVLEIGKHKLARVLNVGVPVGVGVVLVSSGVWLPMLARVQQWEHPTDAYEGSAYLLVFSLVPFLLACVLELSYRFLRITPEYKV